MDSRQAPARYFPVKDEALRMSPGLAALGHDFGNGAVDGLCFQRDRTAAAYASEKKRILAAHPERLSMLRDDAASAALVAVHEWMKTRSRREHPELERRRSIRDAAEPREAFSEVSLELQEDFAVLQRDVDGADRVVLLSVCFPSGWRPERLLGESFRQVHTPVPGFERDTRHPEKLVDAIVKRGPYVRFVWTVTADGRLDHHPDAAPRDAWTATSHGYLRVERQVTVPFPEVDACLFLIRTYVYPFGSLNAEERATLRGALSRSSPEVRRYKGLTKGFADVLAALNRA